MSSLTIYVQPEVSSRLNKAVENKRRSFASAAACSGRAVLKG